MSPLSHPAHLERIDAKRIAGNSLALGVHALAFAVLMMPSSWDPPLPPLRQDTVVVDYVPPRELPPIPPPPTLPPIQPRPRPTPVAATQPTLVPVVESTPVMNEGTVFAEPVDEGAAMDSFDAGPPRVETLAYDVHPAPRYPRQSLRAGAEGTVTLRVLVDERGQPVSVEIERSSGHRDLDRSAREHVLAKWRFHPALREGRAIRAYALVPIEFNLP